MSNGLPLPSVSQWRECDQCGSTRTVYDFRSRDWLCQCHRWTPTPSESTDTDGDSVASYSRYTSASPSLCSSAASVPIIAARRPSALSRRTRRMRPISKSARSICPACQKPNCSISSHRSQRKNCQERANRGDLQNIGQLMQDVLETYGNGDGGLVIGKMQSANNAATSGLVNRKIDIQLQFLAMVIGLLQDKHEDAIRQGTEAEFFAQNRQYIARALAFGDPRVDSWLYTNEDPCEPGSDKGCKKHRGSNCSNWAMCRKDTVLATVRRNIEKFRQLFLCG